MTTTTFEEVKTLATRLTDADKLRLLNELAAQLGPQPKAEDGANSWRRLREVSAEIRAAYPGGRSVADQLEQDRKDRDVLLGADRTNCAT